jgi:hypothetical protein
MVLHLSATDLQDHFRYSDIPSLKQPDFKMSLPRKDVSKDYCHAKHRQKRNSSSSPPLHNRNEQSSASPPVPQRKTTGKDSAVRQESDINTKSIEDKNSPSLKDYISDSESNRGFRQSCERLLREERHRDEELRSTSAKIAGSKAAKEGDDGNSDGGSGSEVPWVPIDLVQFIHDHTTPDLSSEAAPAATEGARLNVDDSRIEPFSAATITAITGWRRGPSRMPGRADRELEKELEKLASALRKNQDPDNQ